MSSEDSKIDEYSTQQPIQEDGLPVDLSLATVGNAGDAAQVERSRYPLLRFRVMRPHAKGGLGKVSLAHDTELKRAVAVKEIQEQFADNPESRARFIFEAEVTGRLEHPGIVPVYALGHHDDGRPYYAMRFIRGTAMDDAIRKLHAIDDPIEFDNQLRELLRRFISVCNTIDYAHDRGYIHRDLKPANVMLGAFAETLVVDWGLAKQIGSPHDAPAATADSAFNHSENEQAIDSPARMESLEIETIEPNVLDRLNILTPPDDDAVTNPFTDPPTVDPSPIDDAIHGRELKQTRAGRAVGTPNYMAPEQAMGEIGRIGPLTDVYCLGATLYHLLVGSPPLLTKERITMAVLMRRVREGDIPPPIAVRPKTRKTLDAICRKAMAVDPKDRYASAGELARDIENELSDQPISVIEESWLDRASRWSRKHRGITATIGSALLVLALISTLFYLVTKTSLDRTKRMLAISQLEQRFDASIHQEESRAADPNVAPDQIAPNELFVADSQRQIAAIESLRQIDAPEFRDTNRRLALLNTWTDAIERLSRRRMNRDVHQTLTSAVDRIAIAYPFPDDQRWKSETERLRKLADERIAAWYTLALPDRFEITQDETVNSIAPSPPGNVQVSADFGGDWSTAKVVGLCLAETDRPGYRFLIADESYHPAYGTKNRPTLSEAASRNNCLAMIVRGDDVLRVAPVSIDVRQTRLPRITARRERGTLLTMQIGDQQLRFEDLFPLPTDQPGTIAAIGLTGLTLERLEVQSQQAKPEIAPEKRSHRESMERDPIERGDEAFASGDFAAARAAYEQSPGNVEAMTKLALVLEFLQPDDYAKLLTTIVDEHSPEGTGDESQRRWYLYAAVRLLLHYLRQPDSQVLAGSVLTRLKVNYDLEDVQSLIPEIERQNFTTALIKPGKRFRVLFDNQEDVEELDGVIELFSNNEHWRRLAYWRKADAIRYDWKLSPQQSSELAGPILDRLIEDSLNDPQADELDRITLVRDRVWMHIVDKSFGPARALLATMLAERLDDVSVTRLPLLIDRARVAIAENEVQPDKNRIDGAIEDLQWFLANVDPASPPPGIHFTHHGEACGILGILMERRGDEPAAQELWLRGRRRNWRPWFLDPQRLVTAKGSMMILESESVEAMLAARTDGYSEVEWREVADELFSGSGLSDVAIRNMIFNSEQVPSQWIEMVCEKTFTGPRGRMIADASMLHQIPMKECNLSGLAMIFYQAILNLSLGGESIFQKHPELDEVLFANCNKLGIAFQEHRIGLKEMGFILAAFTGTWNESSFVQLRTRLSDPDLAAGFAMIFSLMQLKEAGNSEKAKEIAEKFVPQDSAEVISLYRIILNEELGMN